MANRFEGKNLEEALTIASQTLGVERFQLTYHVLLEKRGFLGGMKRVVIEADVNESAAPAVEETARPSMPPPGGGPVSRSGQRSGGGGNRGGHREQGQSGERRSRGGRGRRGRRDGDRDARPRGETPVDDTPIELPPQGEQSDAAKTAHGFISEILRLARIGAEARTEETDERIVVKLYGRDRPLLIDKHGELLDALQVIANKALGGRKVEKDIELDCSDFKAHRVEELGEKARAMAERVRRDGREQLLPAMSPIERRIVHLTLADDADVMTESRGDGFFKRVAIKRREAAAGEQPSES